MLTLTICSSIVLIAMVLRFVQPKLLYGARRVLREVRTNKATLDYEAGRPFANRDFVSALMRDSHAETEEATASAARRRANKLRELYRILDPRNPLPDGIKRHEDPSVCVIELADLIRSLAKRLKPILGNNRPVIPSGSLLRYVANTVREAEGQPPDLTEEDPGGWYLTNPISMEQVIEILIAVVEGVSFRLQAEETPEQRSDYSTGDRINLLERKLRALVRLKHLANYQMSEADDKIRAALGSKDYEHCTRRMEKARESGNANLEFLEFLYFRQLEHVIMADWSLFQPVFQDRGWLTASLERILGARNKVAHARDLSRTEDDAIKQLCEEIGARIRPVVGW